MASIMIRDVDRDDHKELKHWCVEHETTLNALMLRLIAQFIEQQKKADDKR